MTREEAVARIKDHIEIHRYHERNAVKIFEALDMAIKALEQPEPCEDAVSREAVIDTINEWKEACADSGHKETVSDIMLIRKDFIDLPSVTAKEQRWIPCGKCIHADGKHRWCKVLDRTINEDYFCYWAEPHREEGDE